MTEWKEAEFENDVKTYGTQAPPCWTLGPLQFENDVKTYGTQATRTGSAGYACLRMM